MREQGDVSIGEDAERVPRPEAEPDAPPEETQAPAGTASLPPETRISWYWDRLLFGTILAVFLTDQVSKTIIKATLKPHESWPEEGILRITYGTNTGAAFGLFPDQTLVLVLASFFAIGFLYYFYRSHASPSGLLRFAIGLQLGGALGNFIDRIRAGQVVDFIDVGPWPIFNLADSSIVVGIALLIGSTVLRKSAETEGEDQGSPSTPED